MTPSGHRAVPVKRAWFAGPYYGDSRSNPRLSPPRLTRKQIRAAIKRGQANAKALDEQLRTVFSPLTSTLVLR